MPNTKTGLSIFRSSPMQYMQFLFPRESAFSTLSEIGSRKLIRFIDLNPGVHFGAREYSPLVVQCTDLQRQLRTFHNKLAAAAIPVTQQRGNTTYTLTDLSSKFDSLSKELQYLEQSDQELTKKRAELIEMKYVLEIGSKFFSSSAQVAISNLDNPSTSPSRSQPTGNSSTHPSETQNTIGSSLETGLSYAAGIIQQSKVEIFHRMIWIALRGNVHIQYEDVPEQIIDPATGEYQNKSVFVAFYSGAHSGDRIAQICAASSASIYPFPAIATTESVPTSTAALTAVAPQLSQIYQRLQTISGVSSASLQAKRSLLDSIATEWADWAETVARIKSVYAIMNLFSLDPKSSMLIGEGWVECAREKELDSVLNGTATDTYRRTSSSSSSSSFAPSVPCIARLVGPSPQHSTPPTFIPSNKFTSAAQAVVDSYGMARYGEVNPGLATLVTFPYLFGLMFGDFGHGLLFALFSLFLILFEDKLATIHNDIADYFYTGRYLMFTMGLMAAFCGICYNECFSLSMDFGSHYSCDLSTETCWLTKDRTYAVGIDPVWRGSKNFLQYTNSIKMKISVIVGVLHMTVGLIFSLVNYCTTPDPYCIPNASSNTPTSANSKKNNSDTPKDTSDHSTPSIPTHVDWLNVTCRFIPEILLLLSVFGYMCFLIIYKWMTPVDGHNKPMLIRTMINMFLSIGSDIEEDEILYDGQHTVQIVLVIIAVVCIIWMLVPPIVVQAIRLTSAKKSTSDASSSSPSSSTADLSSPSDHTALSLLLQPRSSDSQTPSAPAEAEEECGSVGEMVIQQVIQVIEYVLSTVSHTASYLRLWALSLAHGELAEVFFTYLILIFGKLIPVLGLALGVPGWIATTIAILMAMEGLSAFLHALRLHWVEFQDKFYRADGIAFVPFSFDDARAEMDEVIVADEEVMAEAKKRLHQQTLTDGMNGARNIQPTVPLVPSTPTDAPTSAEHTTSKDSGGQ